MPHPIYLVDAFASGPFTGNPAAVCILDKAAPEAWMQRVAGEMNQAETAFLSPAEIGYNLRWFTPTVEVDLCGHATLASAHVLWETERLSPDHRAIFHTKSGTLECERISDKIEMDFPAEPATAASQAEPWIPLLGLVEAPAFIGTNRMDILVELSSEDQVRNLKPDMQQVAQIPGRGIIFTAQANDYDFVSRFFAPQFGIPEDHATGSAHCCLGPYWAAKLSNSDMVGYQASPRGAVVGVGVRGDRVKLRGQAFITLTGELL